MEQQARLLWMASNLLRGVSCSSFGSIVAKLHMTEFSPASRTRKTALLLGIVCLVAVCSVSQTAPQDFTVVVLPDTQFYSQDFPEIFTSQTQWIVNNISALNIQFVIGEGDIVNGGSSASQWQNANTSVRVLDGQIPYFMTIGNHDYNSNAAIKTRTAGATNFNHWFGPSRYAAYPWFRGNYPAGSNENFYGLVTVEGVDYLILALEFYPRDSAISWADSVLRANPNTKAIIVTHSYMNHDDFRVGLCDTYNAETYGLGNDSDGDELWYKFVRKHPNIFLVLSGHVTGDNAGRRVDYGTNGNLVNQVFANYQNQSLGGGGYLRILKFRPSLNTIEVSTYSPYLDAYKTDTQNQFTLTYLANQPPGQGSGTFKGRVRNGSTCANIAGAKVSYSGGSKLTDSSGKYTFSSVPGPATYNVTLTATGFSPISRAVSITPELWSPLRFFLGIGGTLTGRVTSSAAAPIPNALVSTRAGEILTDSTGKYTLAAITAGSYGVAVSAAGFNSVSSTVSISSGAITTKNFVLNTAPGSIEGTVTNQQDGTAIANAAISYSRGSTTSDASGHYVLSNVTPGTYDVTASADGFAPATQPVSVNAGGVGHANFILQPQAPQARGEVAGHVMAASNGDPITNATVSYNGGSVTSDSTGAYRLSGVPAGPVTITAGAVGYQSATQSATVSAGETSTLDFVLSTAPAAGAIAGRITNASSGSALAGATVSYDGGSALSDSTGKYRLDNLSPGTYTVTASKSGYGPQSKSTTVTGGSTTALDIPLATSGKISGTVTNATGTAIAGATLTITGGVISTTKVTTTSSTGTYSSSWIPVGNYTVKVSKSGFATQTKSATVTTGATITVNFAMQ